MKVSRLSTGFANHNVPPKSHFHKAHPNASPIIPAPHANTAFQYLAPQRPKLFHQSIERCSFETPHSPVEWIVNEMPFESESTECPCSGKNGADECV